MTTNAKKKPALTGLAFVDKFIESISQNNLGPLGIYCEMYNNREIQEKFISLEFQHFFKLLGFLDEKLHTPNALRVLGSRVFGCYERLYNLIFNTFLECLPKMNGSNRVAFTFEGSGAMLVVRFENQQKFEISFFKVKKSARCAIEIVQESLHVVPETNCSPENLCGINIS